MILYKNTSYSQKLLTNRKIIAYFTKNMQKNLVVSNKYCNFAVVTLSNRFTGYLLGEYCVNEVCANRNFTP